MNESTTFNSGPKLKDAPAPGPDSRLRLFSRVAGGTVLLIGGLVLVGGWLLDIELLRSIPLGSVSMKANTALGLAAAGAALWLLREGAGRGRRRAGLACAALTAVIGLLTLAEYALGRSLGIDELLFTDRGAGAGPIPGRPALNTALAFTLLGLSFFALDRETRGGRHFADGFALGAGLIGLSGLLGFAADQEALIAFMPFSVMAVHTAIAVLLLATGLLAARPRRRLRRDGSSTAAGNDVARKPVVIVFGCALGLLAAATLTVWRSFALTQEREAWVARTHEVQAQLNRLLVLVLDVETGARGFMLTGESAFLEPLETGVSAVAAQQRRLEQLVLDDEVKAGLSALEPLIAERIAIARRNVELRRSQGFEAARQGVASGRGKAVMDQIRARLALMGARQQVLLDQHSAAARREAQGVRWLMVTVTGLSSAMLIAVFALMLRENRLRRRANRVLRESEERFRATFEQAAVGIAHVGLDGRWLRVNQRLCEMVGYSPEELLRLMFQDITHADDLDLDLAYVHRMLAGELRHYSMRKRYWRKDGSLLWVNLTVGMVCTGSGEPDYFVSVVEDISAARQAEVALQESETMFRSFFELSPDLVCISDVVGGRFRRINAAFPRVLGYSEEELLARPFMELIHPDDWDRTAQVIKEQLERGETVLSFENRYLRKDGGTVLLEWSAQPIPEKGLSYGIARDVSARRQAEALVQQLNAELRERAAQLEEANRELETFSYSVSHDLRAPLRHIQGYAEMLNAAIAGQLSGEAARYLTTITDASVEMGQLIDDLLAFSRAGRVELTEQRASLGKIVDGVVKNLERAGQERNIVWKIGPLPEVFGDPSMLRQVFVNLLGNAVKYSRERDPAEIEIGCAGEEDGRVVLFVRDNGAGFDMRYAHKLFGVFQRLHRADQFEGTGIGLAIVRRIIARHGGRTWAEGAMNRGATFYVTLQPAITLDQSPEGRV